MTTIRLVVTRHQCPHCRRTWAKRSAATTHVARCWQNPETRGCKTCTHFEPADPDGPYPEHPGWPESCDQERDLTTGLRTNCPSWQQPTT
ncbi:hypothetical protein ACFWHW_03875 [Streptomyces pharetrae]|uniref:hypothetical protein n=1 Tax=Streptomyces pharetrae TaxID=291370 RepID=UPI00366910D1